MIKGSKQTEEAKRKIGLAGKGRISWNKGKHFSEEYRRKLSDAHKGKKLPEEQKRKISESLKGKQVSEETRRRLSESNKGRKVSEETIRKQKESSQKRLLEPEFRRKLSEAHKGQIAWNKGLTKETDSRMKKISEHIISIGGFNRGKSWNKGIPMKSESKLKLIESLNRAWSNPNLRKRQSETTRRVMSNPEARKRVSEFFKGKPSWIKGRTHLEESKIKMSEAHKGKKLSKEHRKKLMGRMPWNKGKKFPEFSGQNHPMFRRHHSEEAIRKMSETHKKTMSNPEFRKRLSEVHKKRLSNPEERKRQSETSRATLLRLYESGSFPKQTNTKPERQIKEELLKRGHKEGIDFIHQYKFMNKFMCDFCFPQQKVIVEVYGDFWHANPKKYPEGSPLHQHQIKGKRIDKSKEAYITKVDNISWTYLVLWESDIKEDVVKCVNQIEEVLAKKKKV